MSIPCTCPKCGGAMSVPNTDAGLSVECKGCRHSFTAPPFHAKWAQGDPDDRRVEGGPKQVLRIIGLALVGWGVLSAISAVARPGDPNPFVRVGQSIGGSICSLVLVIAGILVYRRA
jgi:hypothetical protein